VSSKHKSSSLAGVARTAASGQNRPRERGHAGRVAMRPESPPVADSSRAWRRLEFVVGEEFTFEEVGQLR
jgi:hypothetical protein